MTAPDSLERRRFGSGFALVWRNDHPGARPALLVFGALDLALVLTMLNQLTRPAEAPVFSGALTATALYCWVTFTTTSSMWRAGKWLLCLERRGPILFAVTGEGSLRVPLATVQRVAVLPTRRLDDRLELALLTSENRAYRLASGLEATEAVWIAEQVEETIGEARRDAR